MIEEILPTTVVGVDTTEDPADATLFPEEEELIARAVDKRRREFTTARHCARQAMAKLGVSPVAVTQGERGCPQWPEGIAGSLTHTNGYRGAALARTADVVTVGIDAEPHGPLPEGVLDAVSLPVERSWISRSAPSAPDVHWDRLLFCAKECVYKAWFPLTGRWLGFEDAHIEVDPAFGTFTARFLVPGAQVDGRTLDGFSGRWMVQNGLILAAITLERDQIQIR
jgi:4'-phosphopantetheinyl transferase EntD